MAIETTVTLLEMHERPARGPVPPLRRRLALMRAERIPVHFYRYLYSTIGRPHCWVDRLRLDTAALEALIHAETTQISVLYAEGVPAGFFEISRGPARRAAIAYAGLIEDFHGQGLGRFLVENAVAAAWADGPERITVETCTLDHAAALPLYQKLGFTPVGQRRHRIEPPDTEPA